MMQRQDYMPGYLWDVVVIGTDLYPMAECQPYMEDLKWRGIVKFPVKPSDI